MSKINILRPVSSAQDKFLKERKAKWRRIHVLVDMISILTFAHEESYKFVYSLNMSTNMERRERERETTKIQVMNKQSST